MQEKDLRKWHGYLGISLAIFLIAQAGSGLSISLGHLTAGHEHEKPVHSHTNDKKTGHDGIGHDAAGNHSGDLGAALTSISGFFTDIHHGGGIAGSVYRIFLALGILLQTVTGGLIFFNSRGRAKTRPSKKRKT